MDQRGHMVRICLSYRVTQSDPSNSISAILEIEFDRRDKAN